MDAVEGTNITVIGSKGFCWIKMYGLPILIDFKTLYNITNNVPHVETISADVCYFDKFLLQFSCFMTLHHTNRVMYVAVTLYFTSMWCRAPAITIKFNNHH